MELAALNIVTANTAHSHRFGFDLASGYTVQSNLKTLDERAVLTRVIFLETVAGVPGFSAAMIRHLHSLRRLQGWRLCDHCP